MKNFRLIFAILVIAFFIGSSPVQAFQISANPIDGIKVQDGKLAWEISKAFSTAVSSDQVSFLKNDLPYGQIALLYAVSEASGTAASDILEMRRNALGWGEIAQKVSVKLPDILPTVSSVLKNAKLEEDEKALKSTLEQEKTAGGKAITPPAKTLKEDPKRIGTVRPKAD